MPELRGENEVEMKEVFEHAYEAYTNFIVECVGLAERLGNCVLIALVYITAPLWILPYHIWHNRTATKSAIEKSDIDERKENSDGKGT